MGTPSALSASSSCQWPIAVPIILWDSSCVPQKRGSTFTIKSDPMRGWRTFLRSNMLNNTIYKIFLISPYRNV